MCVFKCCHEVYLFMCLFNSDATSNGAPRKVFAMEEMNGGDARTLGTMFEFMYNGYMSDQMEIKANRLPQLMACADFLQVECVTEACKVLLAELSTRNDVGFCFVFSSRQLNYYLPIILYNSPEHI